jgi:hypothetical protein
MTLSEEWIGKLLTALAPVDGWVEKTAHDAWLAPRERPWTRKDLLGHLTAWSDFLLDQVEALREGRSGAIEAIEVDAWNAAEVERRRNWTVEAIIAAWRQSVRRTEDVISALPPEAWGGRWRVAWSAEPVAIEDVLRLMVVHFGQHRSELADDA